MMLNRWCLVASVIILASLVAAAPIVFAAPHQVFRQKNGLQAHDPPEWFLEGYFIAREKDPGYVFGPVQDFVNVLGAKTTWLIEDVELERLEAAQMEGQKIEYSLFLEVLSSDRLEYWVFVVLPYENAQGWYDGKRAFHGRKAEAYYGKTKNELDHALSKGLQVKSELRFGIENGETRLQAPEVLIVSRYKFRPVFDLSTGRRMDYAAAIE